VTSFCTAPQDRIEALDPPHELTYAGGDQKYAFSLVSFVAFCTSIVMFCVAWFVDFYFDEGRYWPVHRICGQYGWIAAIPPLVVGGVGLAGKRRTLSVVAIVITLASLVWWGTPRLHR
jgi:hypothetical protein